MKLVKVGPSLDDGGVLANKQMDIRSECVAAIERAKCMGAGIAMRAGLTWEECTAERLIRHWEAVSPLWEV